MTTKGARCNEACARATANLIRALIRLAAHTHGWALWGSLGTIAIGTTVWVMWDHITDWWYQ